MPTYLISFFACAGYSSSWSQAASYHCTTQVQQIRLGVTIEDGYMALCMLPKRPLYEGKTTEKSSTPTAGLSECARSSISTRTRYF